MTRIFYFAILFPPIVYLQSFMNEFDSEVHDSINSNLSGWTCQICKYICYMSVSYIVWFFVIRYSCQIPMVLILKLFSALYPLKTYVCMAVYLKGEDICARTLPTYSMSVFTLRMIQRESSMVLVSSDYSHWYFCRVKYINSYMRTKKYELRADDCSVVTH